MVSTRGSDTLLVTGYVRDSLGRITRLVEKVEGITHEAEFTYDTAGRLRTVTRDGALAATYSYDQNGNRLSRVGPSLSAAGTYDDQDRMLTYGGASYAYGANGELRTKVEGTDTTQYTYDALGNLTQVLLPDGTDIEYVIDAQNRRIGKRVNGALTQGFLYQSQLTPVAELDGAGNVVSRFVYATGINVPDYMVKGDSTYRLIRDHLGSVRLVVNVQSGTVAQRLDYDEFGVETQNTNPGFQPFGFAGGLTEVATGLVRFGGRDYAAAEGRWTRKEPLGFGATLFGFYEYSAGDPINRLDPDGRIPLAIPLVALGGGILGATLNVLSVMKENPNYSFGDLAQAAGVGFASGAIGAATSMLAPFWVTVGVGAVLGAGTSALTQLFTNPDGEICLRDVAWSTISGGLTAGIGAGVGGFLKVGNPWLGRALTTAEEVSQQLVGAGTEMFGGMLMALFDPFGQPPAPDIYPEFYRNPYEYGRGPQQSR